MAEAESEGSRSPVGEGDGTMKKESQAKVEDLFEDDKDEDAMEVDQAEQAGPAMFSDGEEGGERKQEVQRQRRPSMESSASDSSRSRSRARDGYGHGDGSLSPNERKYRRENEYAESDIAPDDDEHTIRPPHSLTLPRIAPMGSSSTKVH